MKFKVGDKVKVKNGLVGGSSYDEVYFTYGMARLGGKIFTVEQASVGGYYYLNDGCGYCWTESMLEPIREKLIIYCEDNKTIAKYYNGDKTVTAEAKCAPEDEFNFEYGAKLAMGRAIEKMKEEEIGYSWVRCVGYRQNKEFCFIVDKKYKVYDDGRITSDDGYTYGGKDGCSNSKEEIMKYLSKWYIFEEVN